MKHSRFWSIGLSLMGGAAWVAPAIAIPTNQSDITGTNIWNSTAPIFDSPSGLDTATINRARELSEALERAAAECDRSVAAVADLPRRFARGTPPETPQVCISRECETLNSLTEETRIFLSTIQDSRSQRLRSLRSSRTW